MKRCAHVWSSTIIGSALIGGRKVSRYQVCQRRGCKAKRRARRA